MKLTTAFIRDVMDSYAREEITFSRMVEMINEEANVTDYRDRIFDSSLDSIVERWTMLRNQHLVMSKAKYITIEPSTLFSIIDKAVEDFEWINNYIKTDKAQ